MLVGQYTSKLTDKDRLSVPSKFRNELGEDLVTARWYEECLVLVSVEGWRRLMNRLTGESQFVTAPVRDIDRFVMGSAFQVKLDSQGRFVLPEILKSHAGIDNEAVFVGLGDRVEIWSIEKWKDLEDKIDKRAHEAIEKLAKEK